LLLFPDRDTIEWEVGIMAITEMIRARVESQLKAEAEAVLNQLGLTASEAIRLFYKQVALRKGLPFDVEVPNAATRRAMRELDEGKGVVSPDTTTMVKDLELD
jgi:DNA-damage-inducible protein J